jgi:hypothetical protein
MTLHMKEELSDRRYTWRMKLAADMNPSPSNNFDTTKINYIKANLHTQDNKMLVYFYKK